MVLATEASRLYGHRRRRLYTVVKHPGHVLEHLVKVAPDPLRV